MFTTRQPSHLRQEGRPFAAARLAGCCFVLMLVLVSAQPARASMPAPLAAAVPIAAVAGITPAPVLGFLWLEKYSAVLTTRANILRFCMCVMALALFIMLKK